MALTIDNPELETRRAAGARTAGLLVDSYVELLLSAHVQLWPDNEAGDGLDNPWPSDGRFAEHAERLLDQAVASGEPSEMSSQDWEDIRREGLALINKRKPA